jgi:hypothetical protein
MLVADPDQRKTPDELLSLDWFKYPEDYLLPSIYDDLKLYDTGFAPTDKILKLMFPSNKVQPKK